LSSLPLMPEWHVLTGILLLLSVIGILWQPLRLALPFLLVTAGISVLHAIHSASHAPFGTGNRSRSIRWKLRGLTAFLHLAQPFARLLGRRAQHITLRRFVPSGFPVT